MKACHRITLLIPCLMMTLVASSQGEDFYEARLRAGQEAYRQKRALEAVDQFRIAAFGFLNTPARLSESLARLALAQSAAGQPAEAEATLSRFLDVERRFAPYNQVKLESDIRADFQALLLHRVSPGTLQSIPGLAGLVETEEQKVAKLPSKERRKALEAAFRREPRNAIWPLDLAREASQRQDQKDVLQWTGKTLEISPGNIEALALQVHALVARREYSAALADLKALPQADLDARPELQADKFVCLVESKDWAGAEASLKLVPANLTTRGDVAQAQARLGAESQRRSKQVAVTTDMVAKASKSASNSTGRVTPRVTPAAPASPPATATPIAGKRVAARGSSRAAEALAESRRLVKELKAGEASKILLEALRSEPDNRELRVALLEASCLSGAWNRGAEQVPLVAPFEEGEALPMFYAAVVLYKTGRTEEARDYLERARPRVSGPLVDEYAKKILGRS